MRCRLGRFLLACRTFSACSTWAAASSLCPRPASSSSPSWVGACSSQVRCVCCRERQHTSRGACLLLLLPHQHLWPSTSAQRGAISWQSGLVRQQTVLAQRLKCAACRSHQAEPDGQEKPAGLPEGVWAPTQVGMQRVVLPGGDKDFRRQDGILQKGKWDWPVPL